MSLVVPMRNEEGSIAGLIDSIRRQSRQPDEVLLVDGGSTDRTVQLASELTKGDSRFRVLAAGEATPGRGRNLGVATAGNDWIAFTDAGIVLEQSWLERLVQVAEADPALRVVYGNYEPITNSFFTSCAALAYSAPRKTRAGELMRGPSIASCLLHREAWKIVGGFPDLRAAEDLIFMERVEHAGFRIGWAPRATVWWQLQPSLGATFRKFLLYSRHNVLAGRERYWHYAVARNYLAAAPFIALAAAHSAWWLIAPLAGAVARIARAIWLRREGRGLLWFANPARFGGVAAVVAAIDAATFLGWLQALRRRGEPSWPKPRIAPLEGKR